MTNFVIDSRGKKMVRGGRYAVAKKARHLRSMGLGNAVRRLIDQAAADYLIDGRRHGWTAGQLTHNRLVTPAGLVRL